eukprot:CAMPEP_0114327990 /NCGR_PEP_ID=MMETSP0101-20121206/117_1 /TAXON_ID=38822 ORGANISM="Pteridomonas danica, Strain PT" /NCGR_SAMPLE_ID=MMETSP0101 /ASSEMBLY_ACC=CAM_ASM_000211 /LENGTH=315 /DNA_ID=CAMNT_0001457181 /DNA_START=140 /DNA_END=1087 /DNA_ORIENTATION=+
MSFLLRLEKGIFASIRPGKTATKLGKKSSIRMGRRPNDNLLLEYGFSMVDNMWDNVDIGLAASRDDTTSPLWTAKRQLILRAGLSVARPLRLTKSAFSSHLLTAHRILALSDGQVQQALYTPPSTKELKSSALRRPSVKFDSSAAPSADAGDKETDEAQHTLDGLRIDHEPQTTKQSMTPLLPLGASPISLENERLALITAVGRLDAWLRAHSTTISQDQEMMELASSNHEHNLLCAIRYRLTRKRVVAEHIRYLSVLHKELNRCALVTSAAQSFGAMGLPLPPAQPIESFDPQVRDAVSALRNSSIFSKKEVES